MTDNKSFLPIPPGEILAEEFMVPYGITQNRLARDLHIPPARINDIIHGRRGITVDTAMRFAQYFRTTAQFWMNLQSRFDLLRAKDEIWPAIQRDILPVMASSDRA